MRETAPYIGDVHAFFKVNSAVIPHIVQIEWQICTKREPFKVIAAESIIVNPGVPITPATTSQTKLTQARVLQEGITFAEALFRVSIKLKRSNKNFLRIDTISNRDLDQRQKVHGCLFWRLACHAADTLRCHSQQHLSP